MIEAATKAVFNDFYKNDDKKYKPKWENVKDKHQLIYASLAREALKAAEKVRPVGWQPAGGCNVDYFKDIDYIELNHKKSLNKWTAEIVENCSLDPEKVANVVRLAFNIGKNEGLRSQRDNSEL